MKRREATHECDVCGHEHVHSIEQYLFDTSDLDLDSVLVDGPVSVVVDEFADWHTEIDDGYTKVDQYWDSDASVIVVEVVEQKAQRSRQQSDDVAEVVAHE